MKVVTPQEMARIESIAYDAGSSEETFMENAGEAIANLTTQFVDPQSPIVLLCGKGNNSGDAYVAGRHLLSQYLVVALEVAAPSSPLCKKKREAFIEAGGTVTDDLSVLNEAHLILDGLFGTGFRGPAKAPFDKAIEAANQSPAPIIAIDIPSGLDGSNGTITGAAIKARATIFLGLPKLGFFLNQGWNHIGTLYSADFGLEQSFIDQADSPLSLIALPELSLPPISRNRHKYQAGCVIGVGGSPEMPGAALLASKAALRSGAGMMRLLHPQGMEAQLSSSPYELIKIPYNPNDPSALFPHFEKADALFFGPGMGRAPETAKLLKALWEKTTQPCVIDADALYHIAEHNLTPPQNAILTPHLGELIRLLKCDKPESIDLPFLEKCHTYAKEKNITLVIKGGPTYLCHPEEGIYVSPRGTPGLATAGTGDVLTGILAALLAQGLSPFKAARLGITLHALAGEYAAQDKTEYAMIASDLFDTLPDAFRVI